MPEPAAGLCRGCGTKSHVRVVSILDPELYPGLAHHAIIVCRSCIRKHPNRIDMLTDKECEDLDFLLSFTGLLGIS